MIYLEVKATRLSGLQETVEEMISLAKDLSVVIVIIFNGEHIQVTRDSKATQVMADYFNKCIL